MPNYENSQTEMSDSFLAGDEGFEPPNVGTKSRCLTTWRIPNGFIYGFRRKNLIILPYLSQNVSPIISKRAFMTRLQRRLCLIQ
jgi:hypothetical protein